MASTISAGTTSGTALNFAGDTSGQLQLQTNNGTTAVTVDTAQNVGIGTTTPTDTNGFGRLVDLNGTSGAAFYARTAGSATNVTTFGNYGTDGYISNNAAGNIRFSNAGAERMRIDSSGRLLVATASSIDNTYTMQLAVATANGFITQPTTNKTYNAAGFRNSSNSEVGYISCTASATSFGTSSDYRLKHDIAPMSNALDKVAKLKPVTYKWNVDGSDGEGFIAHELQEVCPLAVTGEKDAMNDDGTIKAQGIDTSFLVATLVAAIQELKAEIDSLKGIK
jgi:hypothetical protein